MTKFNPHSPICLLEPSAFGLDFILGVQSSAPPFTVQADGKAAVVCINGPISYTGGMFDSYEAIKSRVAIACSSDCPFVVLKVNSPGGDVAGAFDTARALRAMADKAGKTLIAYTDADACSAAYALSCVADEISASITAKVGSVGAIAQYAETTGEDRLKGISYTTLTTGERKADGNPHQPMSDESRAALQLQIEQAGQAFFELVSENRGLATDVIRGLQAGVFMGRAALAIGLVDQVESWEELLARLANIDTIQATAPESSAEMPNDDKKDDKKDESKALRASLESAAKAGDAKAKRALAAYDDGDKDEDDKAKSAKAEEDKKDEKAAKAEEDKKEDKKDEGAKAAAQALAADLAAANAKIAALEKKDSDRAAAEVARERAEYFKAIGASETVIKALEKTPLAECKVILGAVSFKSQAVEMERAAIDGNPDLSKAFGPSSNETLNRQMGITGYEIQPYTFDGVVQSFGVMVPKGSK